MPPDSFCNRDGRPHAQFTGFGLAVVLSAVGLFGCASPSNPSAASDRAVPREPGLSIAGFVVSPQGDPMPLAHIEVMPVKPWPASFTGRMHVVTDLDGHFVVGGIEDHEYQLRCVDEAHPDGVDERIVRAGSAEVTLVSQQHVLLLGADADTGETLADVQFSCVSPEDQEYVEPRFWRVRASRPKTDRVDRAAFQVEAGKTYSCVAFSPTRGIVETKIRTDPAQGVTKHIFRLPRATSGQLETRLLLPDGNAVPEEMRNEIGIYSFASGRKLFETNWLEAHRGPDFALALPPGKYRVVIDPDCHRIVCGNCTSPRDKYVAAESTVEVRAGETATARMRLRANPNAVADTPP